MELRISAEIGRVKIVGRWIRLDRLDHPPQRGSTNFLADTSRLLSTIKSGDDIRASSARLPLSSQPLRPGLRMRISRLIRQEIRRLQERGSDPSEHVALRRLTPLLGAVEASRPPAEISRRQATMQETPPPRVRGPLKSRA